VPLVGEPATLDWQPVRLPVKLYWNGWLLAFSPGEMFAVP
jgi:hypothetical protein